MASWLDFGYHWPGQCRVAAGLCPGRGGSSIFWQEVELPINRQFRVDHALRILALTTMPTNHLPTTAQPTKIHLGLPLPSIGKNLLTLQQLPAPCTPDPTGQDASGTQKGAIQ